MEPCRVLVPSGVLGSGCPQDAFDRGVALRPHAIAVDGGSTDSGPYYLGAAVSKMTRAATKRDLRQAMRGRAELGVPLLVGSCGTSGTDAGVDWMADICREIAEEDEQEVTVALLYSEQPVPRLETQRAAGRVSPLPPMGELSRETLAECDHVVALMGWEPFADSITAGADIVLAGRTTDTAVLAAVPLMRGAHAGGAWHAAKVAECGGLCTASTRRGGVMFSVDGEGFEIEPLAEDNRCTPESVSAHMLYENADPYRLKEPGVVLDVEAARYAALDERRVRVMGSIAEPAPYTMKLEGSGAVGFRTQAFSAIADPKVLADFDRWRSALDGYLRAQIVSVLGLGPDDYDLQLRAYGHDALGAAAPSAPPPREVGLMALVTAATQARATEIAKFCNPVLLHFPLDPSDPLPSFAFPFSPAEVELGATYAFKLNHVIAVDHPSELVRTEVRRFGRSAADVAA